MAEEAQSASDEFQGASPGVYAYAYTHIQQQKMPPLESHHPAGEKQNHRYSRHTTSTVVRLAVGRAYIGTYTHRHRFKSDSLPEIPNAHAVSSLPVG